MTHNRFPFLFSALLGCITLLSSQAFAQVSVVTNPENRPSGIGPIEFTNLAKLQSGPGLRVSWVRYNYSRLADGTTIDDKINWLGSYDAYTITNISVETNSKKHTRNERSEVLGKMDDKYWSTMEPGIVDMDSISINRHRGRASYAKLELTNVLTMGFGVHWDLNSIKFSSGGKITGKYKDLNDDLEGIIDYFPDGRMKDCFYRVPKLNENFLLSYTYDDSQANSSVNPSSITLSLAQSSDTGGFAKTMDYVKSLLSGY
jgi:hypothetical protein